MHKKYNARNSNNVTRLKEYFSFFLTLILISSLILSVNASEISSNVIGKENASEHSVIEDTHNHGDENINFPPEAYSGFVYPGTVQNYQGIAIDIDQNGLEDFLDNSELFYSSHEYIDTIITLTHPINDELISQMESLGCRIDHIFTIFDAVGASVPIDKLQIVGRITGIDMIQSVHDVEYDLSQAVPLVKASQSGLNSEGYKGINGEGVGIAVIDSGIDPNHHTFSNRIIGFKDFIVTSNTNTKDYGYHGTMCASCAAGSGTYDGVATKANIISVAVSTTQHMVQGIEWCINNKNRDLNNDGNVDSIDVITMSLGLMTNQRTYLDTAAEKAMDNGIVFVTSAGNDGPEDRTVTSPATSHKVISVGATNKYNKQIADFSSRGPGPGGIIKPDVVAPGQNIIVAYPGNQWTAADGTSFSGPIVAGVCAMLIQYDPDLTPYEIKEILKETALDMGSEGADNTYGWGFIDAVAALDRVLKIKEIEASDYSVLEDTNVVFTATASGTNIEQYDWDFDNDGYFDLTTEENTASYIFSDQDDYTVRVQITNSQSKTAENSVDISVANRKPDAQLAIDTDFEYIYEDNTILFNSSQSWDTPSDIDDLEFSWNFGNGLNFTNFTKEAKIMEHTFQDTGEYTITVRVKDDDGETDETTTTISVYNMKPIADAGGDREVFEDELIHFSGFNSYDTESDRKSLSYFWEFGDGTKGYEMNMTHSFRIDTNNQVYSVSLTVQDNDNANSEDKIKVTVKNRAPIISDIEDQFGTEDDPIELTGQANDSSSDIEKLKYRWIFDDDEETGWLEEPTVTHAYTQMGTYHPRLIVVDPKDAESVRIANVTIDNVAPKCVYTMDKTEAEEDEFITFDPSDTTDTKSDIDDLKYSWDFGDGSSSTMVGEGKVIKHQFTKTARYTIVLTVTDNNGEQDIMEKQLTITNLKPEAKITSENDEYQVDELVRVYGYRSTDTPSDKINLTYSWNFDDGSGWQVAGINTTHKYTEPGDYEIRLKVEDDDSEVDIKKLNIKILQPKKEKENIFENPTFENNGMIIYSGLGLLIVILILIVISLIMYQRNRKGLFGALEAKMKDRRTKKEQQRADQAAQQIDVQTYDFSRPQQEPFGTHGVVYPETQNDAEGTGWDPQGQIQDQPQPQMYDYMTPSQPGGAPYPQPPQDWRQGQPPMPIPLPMQMQKQPYNQTPTTGSEMPPSGYGSSSGSEQLPNIGAKPQMLPPAQKQNDKSEKQTE